MKGELFGQWGIFRSTRARRTPIRPYRESEGEGETGWVRGLQNMRLERGLGGYLQVGSRIVEVASCSWKCCWKASANSLFRSTWRNASIFTFTGQGVREKLWSVELNWSCQTNCSGVKSTVRCGGVQIWRCMKDNLNNPTMKTNTDVRSVD